MKLFPKESLCTVCHSAPNDVYGSTQATAGQQQGMKD
jgi:hypothetical protein